VTGSSDGSDVSRVVFLAGMGRSGSTLLERLLGETTAIAPMGEVMHLWQRGVLADELCGCGRRFSACSFWSEVGDTAFGGWSATTAARVRYLRSHIDRALRVPQLSMRRPPATVLRAVQEYAATFARIYAAVQKVSGCSVVVDSSKQVSLPFCLSWDTRIDLRVIHCVRDPRAVVHAWTKSVSRPESLDPQAKMPTYDPLTMCAYWNLHNAEVALLRRRSVPVSRLRYEDLVEYPAGSVRSLLRFIGVDDPLAFLGDHEAVLSPAHTCAGNPMRFEVGRLPIRRDDVWRRDMPLGTMRTVTALTLPLLLSYGYPMSVRT
jgi:hypothetical protein